MQTFKYPLFIQRPGRALQNRSDRLEHLCLQRGDVLLGSNVQGGETAVDSAGRVERDTAGSTAQSAQQPA